MNTTRIASAALTEYAAVTDALRAVAVPAADFHLDTHLAAVTALLALGPRARTEYESVLYLATAGCATAAERLDSLRGFIARRDALHTSWND